jgi:hypothetical protein
MKSIIIQFLPLEENRVLLTKEEILTHMWCPDRRRRKKCVVAVQVTQLRATSNYNDLVTILRFIVNIGDGL